MYATIMCVLNTKKLIIDTYAYYIMKTVDILGLLAIAMDIVLSERRTHIFKTNI